MIFATIASIFVVSCNSNSSQQNFKSEKESVTVSEESTMLKENALLIDVREPDELAEQSYDTYSFLGKKESLLRNPKQ